MTAADLRGESATVRRTVKVSPYFELLPVDGAAVSGNTVRMSWSSGQFGPAKVRFRPRGGGDQDWKEAFGENGTDRVVTLAVLEAGTAYEWQAQGGDEPGPVRTVTRVKGLAFGKSRYGANIQRDYDQRVHIAVRNHGEKPLMVTLVCGKPTDPAMLVGFVGEGSEGAPFSLNPGEEREFLLCFSAQDVKLPTCTLPIRITSDSGFADEAEVALNVKLPEVKLVWEELGPAPGGVGVRLKLTNQGDALTDLALASDNPQVAFSPAISHGIFPRGASLEVTARPRLFEGFQKAEANLSATAVGQPSAKKLAIGLAEGEQIHSVMLTPGDATKDPEWAETMRIRNMAGAYLTPAYIDWSKARNPKDTDGDGKFDRWTVVDRAENLLWVGDDTNGDGQVDFVHGDVGMDGVFDHSSFKTESGWEETNLVEAWLEMGFKLPWDRSAYEKHDADIILNDTVVGRLRDVIPEGNYRFRIPPSAIKFDANGSPAGNEVKIQSKHLRGGHYVVSSDFRIKLKLTGTRAYAAGKTAEEAQKRVMETPGLILGAPDLSVSSEDLRLVGTPKAGENLTLTASLRNLGATAGRSIDVALIQAQGGSDRELTRVCVPLIPISGATPVELSCKAPAGEYVLKLVLDPDKATQDPDRNNNEAMLSLKVPGDDTKPQLKVLEPAEGATLKDTVFQVKAEATDDVRVAGCEVRVDNGLWTRLNRDGANGFTAKGLLQPGQHQVTVRTVDGSGNRVEQGLQVKVDAPLPEATILEPAEGATIDSRRTAVKVRCGRDAALVAVRVNGGPWQRATITDDQAQADVPLTFGRGNVEVMVANKRGAQRVATRPVECTRQPDAPPATGGTPAPADGAAVPAPAPAGGGAPAPGGGAPAAGGLPIAIGTIDIDGLGQVNLFDTINEVLPPLDDSGEPLPAEPGEQAADQQGPGGGLEPEGLDPTLLDGLEEEEAQDPEGDRDYEDWLLADDTDWESDLDLPDEELDAEWDPEDVEDWDDYPPETTDTDATEPGTPGSDGSSEVPEFSDFEDAGGGSGGGAVVVAQQQSDWYCTNRPTVGVNFQLPDWLMRLNLPKPGTPEFDAAVAKQLAALSARGIDTTAFEKLRDILKRQALTLQSMEQLPTFLQSLGLARPNKEDAESLRRWRESMANGVDAFFLRLLSSGDPRLIAAGLMARRDAMGKFDQAAQLAADACIETIKANQKLTEDVISALPYANKAVSLLNLYRGETLSGEKLSAAGKVFNALVGLGPSAVKLYRDPGVRSVLSKVANKGMWVGSETAGKIASKLGNITPDKLKTALKGLSDGLGKVREKVAEKLTGKMATAGRNFANSADGKAAAALAARDTREAGQLLHRIAQARAGGMKDEYRKLICQLQGNKTAQRMLNSSSYTNEFRSTLDSTHRAMQRLTDKTVCQQVLQDPRSQKQIAELLRKNPGLKAEDIVVRASNVSGNVKKLKDVKPGELLKYGSDRDVVYEFCAKVKQGDVTKLKALKDVHHDIAGPLYSKELRRITGHSAEELDHVVTSRWHPEAYNPGMILDPAKRNQVIGDIISGKAAGKLGRPNDIADTVVHKGTEWMERGHKLAQQGKLAAGNQSTAEGMRQVLKEYRRQVDCYLKYQNLSPKSAMPPRLNQGLDVFQQVQDGKVTVEQARAMLKALSSKNGPPVTPETIVQDLGQYVQFVNKWGLKSAK